MQALTLSAPMLNDIHPEVEYRAGGKKFWGDWFDPQCFYK